MGRGDGEELPALAPRQLDGVGRRDFDWLGAGWFGAGPTGQQAEHRRNSGGERRRLAAEGLGGVTSGRPRLAAEAGAEMQAWRTRPSVETLPQRVLESARAHSCYSLRGSRYSSFTILAVQIWLYQCS